MDLKLLNTEMGLSQFYRTDLHRHHAAAAFGLLPKFIVIAIVKFQMSR